MYGKYKLNEMLPKETEPNSINWAPCSLEVGGIAVSRSPTGQIGYEKVMKNHQIGSDRLWKSYEKPSEWLWKSFWSVGSSNGYSCISLEEGKVKLLLMDALCNNRVQQPIAANFPNSYFIIHTFILRSYDESPVHVSKTPALPTP